MSMETNRTKITDSNVYGISTGYDVYAGGAGNDADGTATDAAQPTDGQQQADSNSADANATDANQQSDAATQSTDQGADQAQTQPATDQQPVVTQ